MKTKNVLMSGMLALGALTSADIQAKTVKVESPADQAVVDAAIAKVYPSLVRIHVIMENPKDGRMQKNGGTGSGTIIHPDGYILTNHHVAGKGTRVWVRLANKEKINAEVVGTDPQTDLCVIKMNMDQVPDSMKPLPVASFGDIKTLKVGDRVMSMGSPAGVSQSVTMGVVANMEMIAPGNSSGVKQDGETVGDLVRWIGHDAVIYFGNSGGPLVNLRGEIIGVNEIGLGSLGGAIPADIAKYVADELIQNGTVRRSWTGMIAQPRLESSKHKAGVLIAAVIDASPAAEAGLQVGDLVTHVDGLAVDASAPEHLPLFNRVVLGIPVAKSVEVKFERDGKKQTVNVTTVERSAAKGEDLAMPDWGITARDLTLRSALALKRENTDGVRVSSISKSGPAASCKPALKAGDIILSVNQKPVQQMKDVVTITRERVAERKAGQPDGVKTLVEFERKGQLLATVVELGKEPNQSKSSAAQRAWVGVETQVLTRELAKLLGVPSKKGVRVTQVIPGSKAEEAGFLKGDLILKMDGQVIRAERERDAEVFKSLVREYPVDESVSFDVIRDGKEMQITCVLQAAPKPSSEYRKLINKTLECTLRVPSKANAVEAKIEQGIYVDSVERAGWASLAGLAGGDVILQINGKEVSSLEMIEKELVEIEAKKSDYIVLLVKRGKLTKFIEIHPIWKNR
ncbi:PDZ domain-containing protein [Verrucomicrobiaceae bacterium N1E253]|uniref:PDZ domain-containing protein n=1 Tax=Oceaniferula marina TaxID=2748318 RepID=A0A851GSC8_9BACT|nr:PDZ domain-containing protein [Oceaniferula marina]NWK57144.1 PDZ domain-containing protein [Oceaniferula marina]